jgi:hypothetical protein
LLIDPLGVSCGVSTISRSIIRSLWGRDLGCFATPRRAFPPLFELPHVKSSREIAYRWGNIAETWILRLICKTIMEYWDKSGNSL